MLSFGRLRHQVELVRLTEASAFGHRVERQLVGRTDDFGLLDAPLSGDLVLESDELVDRQLVAKVSEELDHLLILFVHDVVEENALALLAHPGIGRGHFVADLAALLNRLTFLHRIVKLLLQLVETLLLGLEVHRVRLSPAATLLWSLNDRSAVLTG